LFLDEFEILNNLCGLLIHFQPKCILPFMEIVLDISITK